MTSPEIAARAGELDWIGGVLGEERSEGAVRWQQYTSGAVVVSSARGVHVVYGAIASAYWRCGGPAGGLGAPVTDEIDAGDGVGRYNDFERGSIYWSPTTGAHEVHGNIGARWVADGRVAGDLGYPITDELSHPPYAYQYFQRGALRWTHDSGVERGCPPDRLFGVADTHAHPAAHLGFGGRLISGLPEGTPRHALADCSRDHGVGGTGLFRIDDADVLGPLGPGLIGDAVTGLTVAGLEQSAGHDTNGWPLFDGWPRHDSPTHQQMYVGWVERAYRHGLRMMVALANHSNVLAGLSGGDRGQRDLDAGLAQLEWIKGLASRTEWMEVVYDPAQAREVVAQDKLAVILGLELDTLGGIEQPAVDWDRGARPVTDAELGALVASLHDKGVRYIFPIHLTDNAFGGTALYRDEFITASGLEGRPVHAVKSTDVAFGRVNRNGLSDAGRRFLSRLMAVGMLVDIDHMSWAATRDTLEHTAADGYPVVSGHATFHELALPHGGSEHGATDESRKRPETLQALAARGSFVGVQPVSQPLAPYPSVDALVNADCPGSSTQFARAYLYAVEKSGGRVAIGTDFNGFAHTCGPRFGPRAATGLVEVGSRRMVEEVQTSGVGYTTRISHVVEKRFGGPGQMWSEQRRLLLWAVQLAEAGQDAPPEISLDDVHVPAVVAGLRASSQPPAGQERAAYRARHGLGSGSLHGLDRAVHDDLAWVLGRWHAAEHGPNPPIDRCVTADHDWDFNLEGLAHYGLIPDLLNDLGNLGLSWDSALMPLLTSAQTVVETWERCGDPGARTVPFTARAADSRTLEPRAPYRKPKVPRIRDLADVAPRLPQG